MDLLEYQSIKNPVEEIILKEKGSKFIGYAYAVTNDEDLKARLSEIRLKHPKATHHCYAFRMGPRGGQYRANDDGEPSGSAGLPIYNQLLAHHVTDILVAVVRYYGGTKLGVSGLVKIYKDTAKAVLDAAELITMEPETALSIIFPFHAQNSVFTLINKYGAKVQHFDAAERCRLNIRVKTAQVKNISENLSEMQYMEVKIIN